MAQIDAIVTSSSTRTLDRLDNYVSRPKKGEHEDRYVLRSGINGAIPAYFPAQTRQNRKRFGKDATRTVERTFRNQYGEMTKRVTEGEFVQGYHIVQSFNQDGPGSLNPKSLQDIEKAHQLGLELAQEVGGPGRMATVTTQVDGRTGSIHNHIMIDSIDRTDGHSLRSFNLTHKNLRERHDELLAREVTRDDPRVKLGLIQTRPGYENVNGRTPDRSLDRKSPAQIREQEEHDRWSKAFWDASQEELEAGIHGDEPFSLGELKNRIAATMNDPRATTHEDFVRIAKDENGLDVRFTDVAGRRGASFQMERIAADGSTREPEPGDRRRASKLGDMFSREAIDKAIATNREREQETLRVARQKVATQPQHGRKAGTVAPKPVATPKAETVAPKPEVFVSALRDVEAKGNYKKVTNELADFEEAVVPRLRAGGSFEESEVPRGVTTKYLATHGDAMEPGLREVLTRRAEKIDLARENFEEAKRLESHATEREIRAALDPKQAQLAEKHREQAAGAKQIEAQIRSQIAKGDYKTYEHQRPGAKAEKAREAYLARVKEQSREHDGRSL